MNPDLLELPAGACAESLAAHATPVRMPLAASIRPRELPRPTGGDFVPPVPQTLEETGLHVSLIEQLIL
ncbi:MAG: hypothetical protein FJW34_24550 [Acidobacteria bacterium]|nr:hypothetical protein [Acidobacteriota bacterium]